MNLQPEDMKCLSASRSSSNAGDRSSKYSSTIGPSATSNVFSSKQVSADITHSVSNIMSVSNKLEQDSMEGVDAKEWVCD